jgi:UDP-N-acetylglucosamine--N-acetylmuramyl-(pentapeptide) pyrophosphoryl-undecaprenol N-acetylglucosamine transferase
MTHIVIAAGGTGGHVFPALSLAHACQAQGMTVACVGTPGALEQRTLGADFPLMTLDVQGVRVRGLGRQLRAVWHILRAAWTLYRAWRKAKPDVVLTMGGYVTVPVGLVAQWLKLPLVVHEQNAVPGLSNRLLARWATAVLQAYPDAFPARLKPQTVGNPVRQALLALPPPKARWAEREGPLRVLVLGGSQGAEAMNRVVHETIMQQTPEGAAITWWWQAGEKNYARWMESLSDTPASVRLCPFIQAMEEAYAWADVVIARSGAMTVAELSAVGLGGMLVPFPHAVDDHQYLNAKALAATGAVEVRREPDFNAQALRLWLDALAGDRSKALTHAEQAYAWCRRDAVASIYKVCELSSSA